MAKDLDAWEVQECGGIRADDRAIEGLGGGGDHQIVRPTWLALRTDVAEAHALVDAGAREIVLLGQNVNAWADSGRGLDALIRTLAGIDGLERIRYTTSHPADMTDCLIAAHGEIDKLMPYLHLPVQSGSERILKAMNRSHSTAS